MNFRGLKTTPPLKMNAKTATYSIPTYNRHSIMINWYPSIINNLW